MISGRVGSSAQMGASDFARKATKFPKYKPYFRYLIIDHEGYILLPTYEMKNENYIYEVFTPDGKFINKLKLSSLGFSIIAKGFLYELETSEDKFPSVIRYRLKWIIFQFGYFEYDGAILVKAWFVTFGILLFNSKNEPKFLQSA